MNMGLNCIADYFSMDCDYLPSDHEYAEVAITVAIMLVGAER